MVAVDTNQLLSQVDFMPIDLKTKLIEKLLSSLNPHSEIIEELWKQEIDTRIKAIESGEATLINGDEVFQKIRERLS
ncbi:MAG: addiction module protein [Sulfuricurvum sp.]|nr:addiction module protein [Sulfuricurvum sp.]MDP3021627.1 addiction module protein [Sulfuricurvum sp.]